MVHLLAAMTSRLLERVRSTPRARVVSAVVVYLLVGSVLVAAGLVGTWRGQESVEPDDRWWFLVTLVAACAILPLRVRRPVGALLGGLTVAGVDAILGGSTGVLLVVLDLVHSAARYASPVSARWLRRCVVGTVAGVTLAVFLGTGDPTRTVNVGMLLFALLGTPFWWGWSLRQQAELAAMRSAAAVRDERTRMARDLHDALAGNLSAAAMLAEGELRRSDPAASHVGAMRAVRESTVAALEDVATMVLLLRGDADEVLAPPRLAQLPQLLARARAQGLTVTTDLPGAACRLPAAVDQAAFRIVAEALTNAARHAPAATVTVGVRADSESAVVEIVNTPGGAGLPAGPAGAGLGLVSMRERAAGLGGSFEAGWSTDRLRWSVRAVLPLVPIARCGGRGGRGAAAAGART